MKRPRLVAVGACAVDTILEVPQFPKEDSKTRATNLTKRRGGNCPNSLDVLQQLVVREHAHQRNVCRPIYTEGSVVPELCLMAVLPSCTSAQIPLILSSFDLSSDDKALFEKTSSETMANGKCSKVDLSHCIYRESQAEPVSSYIIFDQSTGSRTIVNHNDLEEMTLDEFKARADSLLQDSSFDDLRNEAIELIWFHFEGRIPPTTLLCIEYLRCHPRFNGDGTEPPTVNLKISVELEKPGRDGLQELAHAADVVLYSRTWAEGEGHGSATQCLKAQATKLSTVKHGTSSHEKTLICTWGDQGACALTLPCAEEDLDASVISSAAFDLAGSKVTDTVGAGDTFIAGMLFGFLCRDDEVVGPYWSLKQKLDFANQLAGRKVIQHGFETLGEQVDMLLWRKA